MGRYNGRVKSRCKIKRVSHTRGPRSSRRSFCPVDPVCASTLIDILGSGILIATYSTYGRLCLYRATIKWESAQGGTNNTFPIPNVQLVHIQSTSPQTTFHSSGAPLNSPETFLSDQALLYDLTHLEIVTGSPETPGGSFPPSVVAVFSSPPVPSGGQSHDGPSSVIVRWEVGSTSQTLHSSFDDVVSKKSVSQLKVSKYRFNQQLARNAYI